MLGRKFILQGRREEEELLGFISRYLHESVITLWPGNYDKWLKGETHIGTLLSHGSNDFFMTGNPKG